MAIGDTYATTDDLKSYLFKQQETKATTLYEADLQSALDSASRDIEKICGRQFNQQLTPSSRVYVPQTLKECNVHDFWTLDGLTLETDTGGTGTFTQEWDVTADVEIFPLNGLASDGTPEPYRHLRACRGLYFPKYAITPYRRTAVVRVTASWGWAEVPPPVHQACLIMAAETWKLRDAPFGVAGFTQFGGAVRVRNNPMAFQKLSRYVLNGVQVG